MAKNQTNEIEINIGISTEGRKKIVEDYPVF